VDIAASAISKVFQGPRGEHRVLDSISLEICRGEFVSIVGPSGGGKTTLLRILSGLDTPTQGAVRLDLSRVSEGMALVEQSALLLPWRTLLQNAALGLELREGLAPANLKRVHDLIFDFGLEAFEAYRPDQLSGGMRQRVAVIRALAPKPRILFCDEPFSSVDFVQRLSLNAEFRSRCSVEGITTVFVTHNIDEAIFLGHRVIVLGKNPGTIVGEHLVPDSISEAGPVACRHLPEFTTLFASIWKELREVTDGSK
jgi:NitT/TauT family transport system ATP-binding protein